MREHSLYQPIIQAAAKNNWRLWRVQDGPDAKAPFDIGGVTNKGLGVALEVKVEPSMLFGNRIIRWSKFEAQQIGWLKAFAERDGIAIVATYFETTEILVVQRIWSHNIGQKDSLIHDQFFIYTLNELRYMLTPFQSLLLPKER